MPAPVGMQPPHRRAASPCPARLVWPGLRVRCRRRTLGGDLGARHCAASMSRCGGAHGPPAPLSCRRGCARGRAVLRGPRARATRRVRGGCNGCGCGVDRQGGRYVRAGGGGQRREGGRCRLQRPSGARRRRRASGLSVAGPAAGAVAAVGRGGLRTRIMEICGGDSPPAPAASAPRLVVVTRNVVLGMPPMCRGP